MGYEAIEGVSSEQYEEAKALISQAHTHALNQLGFYFGMDETPAVQVKLQPMFSSGGVSRDKQGTVWMFINADRTDIGDRRTKSDYEKWTEQSILAAYHETGHALHNHLHPELWEVPHDESPRTYRIYGLAETVSEVGAILCGDLTGFFHSERRKKIPHNWAIDLYKGLAIGGCATAAGLFLGSVASSPIDHAIKNIPEIAPPLIYFVKKDFLNLQNQTPYNLLYPHYD